MTKTKAKAKASAKVKGRGTIAPSGKLKADDPRTDKAKSSKKAFDFKRDSSYVVDPMEVAICGGKGVLPPEESSPLDTDASDTAIRDQRRLRRPLKERFVQGIKRWGVKVAVIIVKINGVAYVKNGKQRIRAARRINRILALEGLPLLKVRAINEQGSVTDNIETMLVTNNHLEVDDPIDIAIKAQELINRTHDKEGAALACNVTLDRLEDYLALNERASERLKEALLNGEGGIGFSVAWEIAKEGSAAEQDAALEKFLSGALPSASGKKKRSVRDVRAEILRAKGKIPPLERKAQRALLSRLDDYFDPHRHDSSTDAYGDVEFMCGVRAALMITAGHGKLDDLDERLRSLLEEVRGSTGSGDPGETDAADVSDAVVAG